MALWMWAAGALLSTPVSAFLPGGFPTDYENGDTIPIFTSGAHSVASPVQYGYENAMSCPYPHGDRRKPTSHQGMGLSLMNHKMEATPIIVNMNEPVECATICQKTIMESSRAQNMMEEFITHNYTVDLEIDSLPIALVSAVNEESTDMNFLFGTDFDNEVNSSVIVSGYPIGRASDKGKFEIVNHFRFKIFYHHRSNGKYRVVGAELMPISVKDCQAFTERRSNSKVVGEFKKKKEVEYTYSVEWMPSEIEWATRWDIYLRTSAVERKIHWMSLTESLFITCMIGLVCGVIFLRTVLQDIARYNNLDDFDDVVDENGWKLLHRDVYRRPWGSRALAAMVGSGLQISLMFVVLLICFALGVLSPAQRGGIVQAAVLLFAIFGGPAGFASAKLNRQMSRDRASEATPRARSVFITATTALAYPSVMVGLYLLANMIVLTKGGISVPFGTVLLVSVIWLFISLPMTVLGAWFGYRVEIDDNPANVNRLPRVIPRPSCATTPITICLVAGFPIAAVGFSELYSVIVHLLMHNFYSLFGYLVVSVMLMGLCSGLTSIIVTYLNLVHENWKWWWPAFLGPASCIIYMVILPLCYLESVDVDNGVMDFLIRLLYLLMMGITVSLSVGTIGFISAQSFVKALYNSVRLE